jgi:hypothetical protein
MILAHCRFAGRSFSTGVARPATIGSPERERSKTRRPNSVDVLRVGRADLELAP